MIRIQTLIEKAKIVGQMKLSNQSSAKVSPQELKALEKILDNLFKSVKIDIEFTKHFLDRVNDPRNKKQITIEELRALFQKTYQKYKDKLSGYGPNFEAVLNDIKTDVNVPFVLKWDAKNNELDLVNKTVMRKKDFKTSNQKLKV